MYTHPSTNPARRSVTLLTSCVTSDNWKQTPFPCLS